MLCRSLNLFQFLRTLAPTKSATGAWTRYRPIVAHPCAAGLFSQLIEKTDLLQTDYVAAAPRLWIFQNISPSFPSILPNRTSLVLLYSEKLQARLLSFVSRISRYPQLSRHPTLVAALQQVQERIGFQGFRDEVRLVLELDCLGQFGVAEDPFSFFFCGLVLHVQSWILCRYFRPKTL